MILTRNQFRLFQLLKAHSEGMRTGELADTLKLQNAETNRILADSERERGWVRHERENGGRVWCLTPDGKNALGDELTLQRREARARKWYGGWLTKQTVAGAVVALLAAVVGWVLTFVFEDPKPVQNHLGQSIQRQEYPQTVRPRVSKTEPQAEGEVTPPADLQGDTSPASRDSGGVQSLTETKPESLSSTHPDSSHR